jgi:DNA-binding MurR/RpiR family transcriptional regulator
VFRIADKPIPVELDLEAGADPAHVVTGVIGGIQRNMAKLESLCDINLLSRTADTIQSARFTGIFGIGASGLVAQDFCQKLIRIGHLCSAPVDTHLQITAACNLTASDAAFIVSYSGESPAMLACAEWAKKNNAGLITLTMDSANSLRGMADIPLLVPPLEPVYRSGATVSRLNQLAMVDMVYTLILSKDPDGAAMALDRTMAATHLEQ